MVETPEQKLWRLRETYPTGWVRNHKIKTSNGLPFEFDNHRFMIDPMDDMANLQVWLKPPQIGATESQIVKSFFCAKKKGWDIIYTLPTQSDVEDMAGGKINRIIAQNPILSDWVKDHDTVAQKSVGSSIIHYRGTWSPKQAMMVSSKCNIHDEVDASNPPVIVQYETRQMANPIESQRRWYFSHPSIAGMGVDIHWQDSDKKEWFVLCPHCNKSQELKWPDNIDMDRRCFICSHCREEMSDETRRDGRWLPTASGRFSGYHISQLMCCWISAEKIVHDFEHKDEQYFYNYVLGLPYMSSENKITAEVVLTNVTGTENLQEPRVIIGVDTGKNDIHYVLRNKNGVFYYKKIERPKDAPADWDAYEDLRKLLNHFDKSILVADQGGDLLGIRRLRSMYPGRVFLCFYRKDRKTMEMIKWGEQEEYGNVVVDRNRMISMIVEHLRQPGYIPLNGQRSEWELFASHFNNIYRELVVGKETLGKDDHTLYGNEYIWKRSGADHFVHALVYAQTGYDRFGASFATVVKKNDGFMDNVPVGSAPSGAVSAARIIRKPSTGISGGGTYTPDF